MWVWERVVWGDALPSAAGVRMTVECAGTHFYTYQILRLGQVRASIVWGSCEYRVTFVWPSYGRRVVRASTVLDSC